MRVLLCIVIVGSIAFGLTACNGEDQSDNGQGAQAPDAGAMTSEVPEGSEAEGGGEEPTPEGRISSGAFQLKPTATFPARPEPPAGQRRIVPLEEAIAGATFQLLEPKDLPEDSHRDVVHLESPVEGEPNPALPAVRFVYTLGSGGALIMYQHPATGEAGPGEPVDIGGILGWALDDDAPVVTWEQDGIRIELRGKDVDLETLLTAARSVGPLEATED